jgi:hypothetical protein
VYVVLPDPVFWTVKSKKSVDEEVTLATAPSGITIALPTTVSFHWPDPDAPVGRVDVTVSSTVPAPGLPVVNSAVAICDCPGIKIPVTNGHDVMVMTDPVLAQLVA